MSRITPSASSAATAPIFNHDGILAAARLLPKPRKDDALNRLEARIRDPLALNLHRPEPGLELIAAEYKVDSIAGAAGFLDLLARDRLGHFVLIEIKRSDQSARSATHSWPIAKELPYG